MGGGFQNQNLRQIIKSIFIPGCDINSFLPLFPKWGDWRYILLSKGIKISKKYNLGFSVLDLFLLLLSETVYTVSETGIFF